MKTRSLNRREFLRASAGVATGIALVGIKG